MPPSYYQILEVAPGASHEEIHRSYRRLAKRWHPDVNHAPEARERFVQIQRAWETLGDPQQRERYDYRAKRYSYNTPQTGYSQPGYVRNPNAQTRAYSGFGGRVYYRTTDPETFKREEKLRVRDMIAGGAVILLILAIPLLGRHWNNGMLCFIGKYGVAEIIAYDQTLIYSFSFRGEKTYAETMILLDSVGDENVIPGGMPLNPGDLFQVRFLPDNTETNRINLSKPAEETREKYNSMIYLRWQSSPLLDSLAAGSLKAVFLYTLCDSVFAEFGTEGLANLYYAETSKSTNPRSNSRTFRKMCKTPGWSRILKNCRAATRGLQ